jgi:hypothetical protein
MTPLPLKEQIYSVLALYGIQNDPVTAAEFYTAIVQWCADLGHIPNKSLVHGDGFSGKCISFNHNNAKLANQGFALVSDFEIFAIPDNAKNPMFEYLIDIIYAPDSSGSCLVLAVNSEIACITDSLHSSIVDLVIRTLNPAYGIGYLRELGKGPSLYAVGIGQGKDAEEYSGDAYREGVRHAHWGYTAMKEQIYREGIIRDVYPWNLLTKLHLEASINGISLYDWIKSDNCGTLRKVNDECWIWEIKESNVAQVRSVLWDAGIIFNQSHYLS